ncbi:hypothetical protein LTR37_020924 [Vermiconidia calcicola]|uniref:Uncharacterized protein n=1 Tax=Vermiconidia calcicola TaxID=1690605 RepID=A0ACC3M9U8_9PEZI|nr:hypothetical protein LTR37_020924 [Vermiconidia calcicola]
MPNKLSKVLPRSKEKVAEAEAERNGSISASSSPPPGYEQEAPEYDKEHALDPPDITAGFSKLSLGQGNHDIPQLDQCIAHLKVLECFYRLRQDVGSQDGLFGIEDWIVTEAGLTNDDETPEILTKLAEKRWALYVSRAVDRFETWSAAILPTARMLTHTEFETKGKAGTLCTPSRETPPGMFTRKGMPPADVLMVWHAYMLNPRAYLEDCLRLGRMQLWHAGMPWQAANDCINSATFGYEAGAEAEKDFTRITGLPWNNLDDLREKQLNCPGCDARLECPYTTPDFALIARGPYKSSKSLAKDVDAILSTGSGYCDKGFQASCPKCRTTFNHERLRAKKFCNDVEKLLSDQVPMGGTVLGKEGIPIRFGKVKDTQFIFGGHFPKHLLLGGLGRKILGQTRQSQSNQRMETIRYMIEQAITDRGYVRQARGILSGRLERAERISIRRMMSRYWDNSSPFALDLVGAVIRQGSFVEKMHNIDWLHSPALPSTMKRLIVKYKRFTNIMKDRLHMAVPTLDVDLAWHTHQLSPYSYMKYTVAATGQFVDHDDKVAETALNEAFAWTSKTYQALLFVYMLVLRSGSRESHQSCVSAQANEQLHAADQDPRKSVHISSHNAVRPDDYEYQKKASQKAAELESHYQKACERARKKGRKAPKRDDYYYSDAWGYPVYIPAYTNGHALVFVV